MKPTSSWPARARSTRKITARRRILDMTVRVGSPQFDNYRRVGNDRPRFTSGISIALDDNPVAIRQEVWLATDRVYRAASNRLIRIKADEKLRAAADDTSDDFSKEEPQVFFCADSQVQIRCGRLGQAAAQAVG